MPNVPGSLITSTYDSLRRIIVYIRGAERNAELMLQNMINDPTNHRQYRAQAIQARNELLTNMRRYNTPFARAFSVAIKEEGKRIEELVEMYMERIRQSDNRNLITPTDRFRSAVTAVMVGRDGQSGETDWIQARKINSILLLRSFARQLSPEISRRIINASGRTNKLVNIVAYSTSFLGIAAGITASGLAIAVYNGDESVSQEILDTLTITSTTAVVSASASVLTQLGSGLISEQVGQTNWLRRKSTMQKVGFVIFIPLFFSILVAIILGISFDDN